MSNTLVRSRSSSQRQQVNEERGEAAFGKPAGQFTVAQVSNRLDVLPCANTTRARGAAGVVRVPAISNAEIRTSRLAAPGGLRQITLGHVAWLRPRP